MIVNELIDYLQQFPGDTRVVLHGEAEQAEGEDFIDLAYLYYGEEP